MKINEEYNKELQTKYANRLLAMGEIFATSPKSVDNDPSFKSELLLCAKVAAMTAKDKDVNVCEVIRNHVIEQKKRLIR